MIKTNPILYLPIGTNIISILSDDLDNIVLLGTDDGKIIKMDKIVSNAYLSGKRSVYAQVKDGYGNISDVGWGNLIYELRNKILEVSDNKAIMTFKTIKKPYSANVYNEYKAVFTSPILYAGYDFINWKNIQWQQETENSTSIDVYVRVGKTEDEILDQSWIFVGNYDVNDINVSLDNFNNFGSYVQVKAILSTENINESPSLHNLRIFYKKSSGVYFYTKKYKLSKNTNPKSLMIVANVSEPKYTEIKFGICGEESGNWSDYHIVDVNKMIDVPSSITDKIKIGIKLSSYSTEIPIVDEFGLIFSSEKKNYINK